MHHKAIALERTIYRRFGPNPPIEKFRTVGRDYLHAAVIGVATKDFKPAQESLEYALSIYPPLLDEDQPLESLVRAYTPSNSADEALAYIGSMFQDLLPHTSRLSRLKSRLLSDIHMGEAFKGAKQSQPNLWKGTCGLEFVISPPGCSIVA